MAIKKNGTLWAWSDHVMDYLNEDYIVESPKIVDCKITSTANYENILSDSIQIYPNPSNGDLNIENANDYNITFQNSIGNFINPLNYSGNNYNISNFTTGIYFIKFNRKNYTNYFYRKIIITK